LLRHTFGTHAALFGVNPWRLQSWMGHKRIDETMIYVHVAENHRRDLPEVITTAGDAERDPDKRILAMLSARSQVTAKIATEPGSDREHAPRSSRVAAEGVPEAKTAAFAAV
jgi:hypothetical protein